MAHASVAYTPNHPFAEGMHDDILKHMWALHDDQEWLTPTEILTFIGIEGKQHLNLFERSMLILMEDKKVDRALSKQHRSRPGRGCKYVYRLISQ